MTQMMTDFVPAEFDAYSWEIVEPLYTELQNRPVESVADFERWLLDRSELDAAVSESAAKRYVNMTCDTADEAKEKAYLDFVENVMPKLKPASFELDKRQAALAEVHAMPAERYSVMERDVKAGVELYRDENAPIQTELAKMGQQYDSTYSWLSFSSSARRRSEVTRQACSRTELAKMGQQYDSTIGAMTVEFDGEERTLPQMGTYQESQDRSVREQAWRVTSDRRLADEEKLSQLYDDMVAKRHQMALNAGFDNFVGYAFKAKGRFDYTPEMCFAFHDAIEKHVMPFVKRLDAKRTAELGVGSLRPWDLSVDPKGRAPLKPFTNGADLVAKTRTVFDRLDPKLGAMFRSLGDGTNDQGLSNGDLLDLDSRKGKAPGGYQYMQDRSRVPFIFMNAAGLHRDVKTMVHEAGHAFHSMLCVDEPLVHYRESPIEFAEVASMTMELLTMPYWDAYYPDPSDADRARRKQMEGSIGLLPWIATIDAFQHWVYTNPEHTRDERAAAWLGLDDRFGHAVDWAGLEAYRPFIWQRQSHLYGVPFYYVEYGIAQLGALGIWLKSLEEGEGPALAAYTKALSLGGSRPLPELFEAADLPFDFGDATVARLVERVEKELEKLPE